MRELKLRAWDKLDKQYVYIERPSQVPSNWAQVWELEQWTGLKDGRGADIYEGDVVRTVYGTTGVIIYYLGQYDKPRSGYGCIASFEIDESKDGKIGMRSINTVSEVIGNIHEGSHE